ncbi:RING-box protein 1 [Cichlidogyrus casuarinus]|uniref:RING-box protein 1 n=1 Tax=Cichlidogyrus casuarinus TaxID=1844966 RepID=A0ABD2PUW4_9PLAT
MEMDIDEPETGAKQSSNKRFEIKKWNAVALWAWDIVVDSCAICRNHIMDHSRFPFPLYLQVAQDPAGVSVGQQGLGIPKCSCCSRLLQSLCGQKTSGSDAEEHEPLIGAGIVPLYDATTTQGVTMTPHSPPAIPHSALLDFNEKKKIILDSVDDHVVYAQMSTYHRVIDEREIRQRRDFYENTLLRTMFAMPGQIRSPTKQQKNILNNISAHLDGDMVQQLEQHCNDLEQQLEHLPPSPANHLVIELH